MSVTCAECSIRYAKDLPACPWCGHVPTADAAAATQSAVPAVAETSGEETPTHTETRAVPPPPPPRPRENKSGSVTYDLGQIPGPTEEWEPVDEWIDDGYQADEEEEAEAWTEDEPRTVGIKRWAMLLGGGVLLIAVGAWLAEVLPIDIGGNGQQTIAATTPITTLAPPATTTAPPPSSTSPPVTTLPPPTIAIIDPVGDAIATSEMRIFETGFGPLEFGDDGVTAVGRLVATLGQPDEDTGQVPSPDADGAFCTGDMQRQVRWGSLSFLNRVGSDGSETFTAVLLRSADASDPDPGGSAATLSGLKLGTPLSELRSLYDGFKIDVFPDDGNTYEIRAGSDGRLLLWGTTTGADPDVVTSIRSPLRCDT
ncbi:MAG: hypothetical protein OES13_07360 [Acidimicrobiia bacterium]|nr:hypothetical protein [Acidimicrobiia bacterium]